MHEVACYTVFNIFANAIGLIGNLTTSINGIGTAGAWVLVGMIVPLTLYLVFVYKTHLARFKYETNSLKKAEYE